MGATIRSPALHTVRRFSGLAHLPIPSRYPTYLSRDDFVAYLNDYARHFGLTSSPGRASNGSDPGTHDSGMAHRDGSGRRLACPRRGDRDGTIPKADRSAVAGRETYAGRLTHSVSYTNAAPYAGQRVLVVGAGNSGAEIATDLSDNGAAAVALSVQNAAADRAARSIRAAGAAHEHRA